MRKKGMVKRKETLQRHRDVRTHFLLGVAESIMTGSYKQGWD